MNVDHSVLLRQVAFVAQNHADHSLVSFFQKLLIPHSLQSFPGFTIRQVKDEESADCAFEVNALKDSELILARSVPDLEFHFAFVNLNVLRKESASDGWLLVGSEVVHHVASHQ